MNHRIVKKNSSRKKNMGGLFEPDCVWEFIEKIWIMFIPTEHFLHFGIGSNSQQGLKKSCFSNFFVFLY